MLKATKMRHSALIFTRNLEEPMNILSIFAHNESRIIRHCLDSVIRAPLPEKTICFVLANGCSDDTVQIVKKYAESSPWIQIVDIPIGDKSNAWNVLIHDIAPIADCYFFLDGDCLVESGAFDVLEKSIKNSNINAASGVPSPIFFSTHAHRRKMINGGGLSGNLYALSGDFVQRIRSMKIRLPIGFIGDDSLVGALALWDLETTKPWDGRYLVVCDQARFTYEPIWKASLYSPGFYIRRLSRYSLRYFQNRLLAKRLKTLGISALPKNVEDIYAIATDDELKPRSGPVNYLFDLFTIKMIREKQRKL